MKKRNRWKAITLSILMVFFYCLPVSIVHAQSLDAKIEKATAVIAGQKGGKLQPGDAFTLKVKVFISGYVRERDSDDGQKKGQALFFTDATVSGAVTEASKPYLKALTSEKISGDGVYEFEISGLVYSGSGNEVSVCIKIEDNTGSQENVYVAQSDSYTLEAYKGTDFADTLTVEKQENLLVKSDGTQNVKVKVTNKGNFTINQADVTLSLDNKVEGLKIKNEKSEIKNIKPKEVKAATFSISADKDTKAGAYPATVTVLGNSYHVILQVDSNVVPSALEIALVDKGIFTPGVEKMATLEVKNVGDRDAKNIRIELVNTENVSVVENSNVKRLNVLQAKSSQSLPIKVRINSDYKGESVAIPIKFNYLSSTGEAAEDTQYVYLYTNSTVTPSEVTISNVISPSGLFDVDQNFTVKFNVAAKSTAKNVQISVEGDEGIVPKSQNLFFINKLVSGEKKQYSVSFAATREAVTSSHPIKITVTYGKTDNQMTINQYGSVNIKNSRKDKEEAKEEGNVKGKPKVIIGQYSIEPKIVRAGENFVLTLGFLNTSSKHTVHNLKANILPVEQEKDDNDKGNVFTPVNGSNTIYIADLGYEETVTKVLTMYTIPSAAAKTYQITVDMAYEDEEGNEMAAQESLGIPVEQMTKIEVGDINISPGMIGDSIPVSVAFYNRGRTKVNNMMVYIEGEGFEVQDNKTFIGSFDMGDSETYEPTIIPQEAGKLAGKLVVEYEDPSGEAVKIEKDFEIEAEEMPEDGMASGEMPEENNDANTKGKVPVWVGIGVGGVVLVILIGILIKKKKAQKEKMMLDEEE